MSTKQNPAPKRIEAVTVEHGFFPATSDGDHLFSVRAGIPLSDAFDQLTMMLGSSIDSIELLVREKDVDSIPGSLWQSVHFLKMNYALIEAMHSGHNEHVKAANEKGQA